MTSRNETRLQHRETATMCTRVRLVESRFGRNGCASRRWDRLGMQALCNLEGQGRGRRPLLGFVGVPACTHPRTRTHNHPPPEQSRHHYGASGAPLTMDGLDGWITGRSATRVLGGDGLWPRQSRAKLAQLTCPAVEAESPPNPKGA